MSNTSSEKGSKSALHASLESKKDQSYYYAHQPRGTCEAPAPPPIHQVLRKDKHIPEAVVESIHRYQFLDEEKKAKVFIPLEGVGRMLDECVESEFKEKGFTVSVREYKVNTILRLYIAELEGEIIPEDCFLKKMENKLVVHLSKKPNEEGNCFPWRNLKK